VNVKLESGYGSGQDAHLVRARIRFHAKRNEAVRITVC
jgi:hypothetical protein